MPHSDNEIVILRSSRGKALGLFVVGAVFTACGIGIIYEGRWIGWLAVTCFGLCMIVALIDYFPGASFLRLTPEGFTVRTLYRSHRYRWDEVASFGIASVGLHRMIVFNFAEDCQKSRAIRSVNGRVFGYEASLPDA